MTSPSTRLGTWCNWIERILDLPAGNLARASLLFACMFLVITTAVLGKVARDALFLARLDARSLPWADISVGLLVAAVFAGYVRVDRRLVVRDLVAASMLFFSVSCAAMWAFARAYHPTWLYVVIYVWVGALAVLAPAQIWTLANYVLTSREARRSFSFIGSGAIAGCILAGIVATAVVPSIGTENLLLFMVFLLAGCAMLVVVTWRSAPGITSEVTADSCSVPKTLRQSFDAVFSTGYLRAIAAIVFLSSFTTTVIAWQFKAIARQYFSSGDSLALFFGRFNLYAGIIALVVQLVFATRILERFGIGRILFCLPVALFGTSVGFVFSSGLAAAIALRGADQVLRYSLDKPSVELLYLPMAARVKLHVKWFIDAVVWRAGDALAGGVLLILVSGFAISAFNLAWMIVVMTVLWAIAAWRARVLYLTALKQSIDQHAPDLARVSLAVVGSFTCDLLTEKLRTGSEAEVLTALDLIHNQGRRAGLHAVRALLPTRSPRICAKAFTILADAGDASVLQDARSFLSHSDDDLRAAAIRYVCRYSHLDPLTLESWVEMGQPSLRAAIAEFLAHPGPAQNVDAARRILAGMVEDPDPQTRIEAARVFVTLPKIFHATLSPLINDPEPGVACEAIRAVGSLHEQVLIPVILGRITDPATHTAVIETLVSFGDEVADFVGTTLADSCIVPEVRMAIISVLDLIGTQKCVDTLQSAILEPDTTIRWAIVKALGALRRSRCSLVIDTACIESLLVAEAYGNYRSFQVYETFLNSGIQDSTFLAMLKEAIEGEQQRIFGILSTLYPHSGFRAAYEGLRSGHLTLHDNALEFLDNILTPALRRLLLPLFDPVFTTSDRACFGNRLLSAQVESTEDAIRILCSSGDPKLRMCAAWAKGLKRPERLQTMAE